MKNAKIFIVILGLILGLVFGTLGTIMHRFIPPWGLVITIGTLIALAIAMRSSFGWTGMFFAGAGWIIAVQYFSLAGPSDDVLVADDWLGYAWMLGGLVAFFVGIFYPRQWLQDSDKKSDVKGERSS